MRPLSAPQRSPLASTTSTPSADWTGVPTTRVDARQFAITNTMPTDRSRPEVRTGIVWAMATKARRAPLLAAVLTILRLKPAGCCETKRVNIATKSAAAMSGPRFDESQ